MSQSTNAAGVGRRVLYTVIALVVGLGTSASLVSALASAFDTRMKRRLPPSSAFIFMTAWAVVPEPAKKSSTMSSGPVAMRRMRSIKPVGFGVEKARASSGS